MSENEQVHGGNWTTARSLRDVATGANVLVAFPDKGLDPKVVDWRPCVVVQDCKKKGSTIVVETKNGGHLELKSTKAIMVWKEKKP